MFGWRRAQAFSSGRRRITPPMTARRSRNCPSLRTAAAPALYCRAARAAVNLKKVDLAFEILTISKDTVAGSPEWRAVATDAIRAEFEQVLDKVRDRLKLGMREAVDDIVAQAVKRVVERYATLDPIGAPVAPPSLNGRVLILANVDLRQCTHYRVEQKQELLETLGRDYAVYPAAEADAFISALPFASAAIFYRLPASTESIRAIEVARAMGIPPITKLTTCCSTRRNIPSLSKRTAPSTKPSITAFNSACRCSARPCRFATTASLQPPRSPSA